MTSATCSEWRGHDPEFDQSAASSCVFISMIISTDMLVLVADLALGILGLEVTVLMALRLRSASPPSTTEVARRIFLLTTLSGFGLLFALRGALVQAHPALILAGLSLGGIAHAADLYLRTREADQTGH
jgi:hypothetical protein